MFIRYFLMIVLGLLLNQTAVAIEPVYEGEDGIRAKVFATNCLACHSSNLVGSQRNGAPSGLNWDVYETAKDRGNRIIVRAVQQMNMPPTFSGIAALNQEQKDALVAWQQAGFPRIMEISETAIFDFSDFVLTIPSVNVGNVTYKATLLLVDRPSSPTLFGFQLLTAEVRDFTSTPAAVFDVNTGVVQMPEVMLLNGNNLMSDKVSAEMLLVQQLPILIFDLTALSFL